MGFTHVAPNKENVGFLDPRVKPEWELLDLRDNTGDFEHSLFVSVTSEFVDIAGFDCHYYIKKPINMDVVYEESTLNNYIGPYPTKFVFEVSNDGIELTEFGISSTDIMETVEMSKAIFQRDVLGQIDMNTDINYPRNERKPMPTDLIKTLWDNKLWEVSGVTEGQRIFHGMKLVWSLTLVPFDYSKESSDAKNALYIEPSKDDYPEVNNVFNMPPEEEFLVDNNIIKEEAHKNRDDSDIDTKAYGYDLL